jgi:rod shape-determining protein MreC
MMAFPGYPSVHEVYPVFMRVKILAFTIVLILLLVFARGFFERAFHIFQKPLVEVGTWVNWKLGFLDPNAYNPRRVLDLQEQLQTLALDRVTFEQLQTENKELRETLGFIERQNLQSVMASIVSRSSTTQVSIFSIDRGEEDGIRIGDPVVVKDGILVGKVVQATSESATIYGLTDPSVATAVSVLNQTQTIGVAEGIAGNLLRLKFIPQDAALSVNDLVVSSGLESNIPSGLFIGLINDVQQEPNAPFLQAIIEPLVDMRQYTNVHVLIQDSL